MYYGINLDDPTNFRPDSQGARSSTPTSSDSTTLTNILPESLVTVVVFANGSNGEMLQSPPVTAARRTFAGSMSSSIH